MSKDRLLLYQQSLVNWGTDFQIMMLFEEMAELTVAVTHCFRDSVKNWDKDIENIAEEIADVRIMLEQIAFIFEIPDNLIREQEEKKLLRLKKRLSGIKSKEGEKNSNHETL